MERTELWRRVELGAAVATVALTVAAGLLVLFAPLVTFCTAGSSALHAPTPSSCPVSAVHAESLLAAQAGLDVWAYLAGMVLVLLIGAGSAARNARRDPQPGMTPLVVATVLAMLGFLIAAATILGLIFLPPVLGLAFACAASVLRRRSMLTVPGREPGAVARDVPRPTAPTH